MTQALETIFIGTLSYQTRLKLSNLPFLEWLKMLHTCVTSVFVFISYINVQISQYFLRFIFTSISNSIIFQYVISLLWSYGSCIFMTVTLRLYNGYCTVTRSDVRPKQMMQHIQELQRSTTTHKIDSHWQLLFQLLQLLQERCMSALIRRIPQLFLIL